MRSTNEHQERLDGSFYRELRLLEEVDGTPELSQRKLAHSLGIALGVANILVRKVAKKGYIRISQRGWRRWAYVLTPAGMARKLQLTMEYIENILDHYRKVRRMLREDLSRLPLDSESRVAIVGTSGLAELTYLALLELGVTKVDVFSQEPTVQADERFLGMALRGLQSLRAGDYSKVVIAVAGDISSQRAQLTAQDVEEIQIVEPFLQSVAGHVAGVSGS